METACLRHTELPGITRLFSDHQYHFDRVAKFYSASPWDFESYRQTARQISYPEERRAALVTALRRQNGESPLLEELARPDTVAVVTGQQIGLFSGPAYTIYKALTAIRLAARLKESGVPAVPVFWLATEDHDFAEINEAWVFDADLRPVRLQSSQKVDGHAPVGSLKLKELPFAELESALSGLPFGPQAIALARDCYQPGRSWTEAFRELVKRLLSPEEILFVDRLDPALREITAPLMAEVVKAAPTLGAEILERNAELERDGYHAQVHFEKSTSLFFLLRNGERITLRRQNGDYLGAGQRYSTAELAADAANLSPNALLRPVVQDCLLPTVAYVGGPAELAYLAQSSVIYRHLLGHMPVAVSRSGFTILDARARKIMTRYGLSLADVLRGESAVREHISRAVVPAGIVERTSGARETASKALSALKAELASFDPTLAAAAAKSESKILYQFSRIAAKTAREALRRDERAANDAAYVSNLIFPHDHLQERLYSGLALYARFGPELAPELYERVHPQCPDHQLVSV